MMVPAVVLADEQREKAAHPMSPEATAALAGAIGGVAIGFLLTLLRDWWERKRRLVSHLSALKAEAQLCKDYAEGLNRSSIKSPSYRFPTAAFGASFPLVLGEGVLTEEEVMMLTRFFNEIETINRGLDQADRALAAKDTEAMHEEARRNKLKATKLAEDFYPPALQIIEHRLNRAERRIPWPN
jgi:hypothetical protein